MENILIKLLSANEIKSYQEMQQRTHNYDFPVFDALFVSEMVKDGFNLKKYGANSIKEFIKKYQPIFDYIIEMISLVCDGNPIYCEIAFPNIVTLKTLKRELKNIGKSWSWDWKNVKSYDLKDQEKKSIFYLRGFVKYEDIDVDTTIKINLSTYLIKKEIYLNDNAIVDITHVGEYLEDLIGEPNYKKELPTSPKFHLLKIVEKSTVNDRSRKIELFLENANKKKKINGSKYGLKEPEHNIGWYNEQQLKIGMHVEFEHLTDENSLENLEKAALISMHHLNELPDTYYTLLLRFDPLK